MLEVQAKLDAAKGKDSNGTLVIPIYVRGFYGELTIPFDRDSYVVQSVLDAWREEEKRDEMKKVGVSLDKNRK